LITLFIIIKLFVKAVLNGSHVFVFQPRLAIVGGAQLMKAGHYL